MLGVIKRLMRKDPPPWNDIQPISAEIFGLERLKQHARGGADRCRGTCPSVYGRYSKTLGAIFFKLD